MQSFAKVGIQKQPHVEYRQLRSTEVALALVHTLLSVNDVTEGIGDS